MTTRPGSLAAWLETEYEPAQKLFSRDIRPLAPAPKVAIDPGKKERAYISLSPKTKGPGRRQKPGAMYTCDHCTKEFARLPCQVRPSYKTYCSRVCCALAWSIAAGVVTVEVA